MNNTVEVAAKPQGQGIIETYTVEHTAEGPVRAIIWGKMVSGSDIGKRFLAVSTEAGLMRRFVSEDCFGLQGTVVTNGKLRTTYALSQARL